MTMFRRAKDLFHGFDSYRKGVSAAEISEPHLIGESMEGGEEEIPSFEDIDRMILLGSGYSEESPRFRKMLESIVADSEDERIFKMDKNQSFLLNDMVDRILINEVFDNYWHTNIRDRLDPEADAKLLEQWTDDFMGEEVRKFLLKLNRDEKFYYIEFFRELLSKSDNDEAVNLIDFNDPVFEEMPDVTRIY